MWKRRHRILTERMGDHLLLDLGKVLPSDSSGNESPAVLWIVDLSFIWVSFCASLVPCSQSLTPPQTDNVKIRNIERGKSDSEESKAESHSPTPDSVSIEIYPSRLTCDTSMASKQKIASTWRHQRMPCVQHELYSQLVAS